MITLFCFVKFVVGYFQGMSKDWRMEKSFFCVVHEGNVFQGDAVL
jgi:hypothetical protein